MNTVRRDGRGYWELRGVRIAGPRYHRDTYAQGADVAALPAAARG